jgi:TonB-dependent receptor
MKSLFAMLTTTTAIVALAAPAHAAEARDYAIEAGSLEAALDAYGRQSGEQVLYRVDDVRGRASEGVKGRYSPEHALRKILAGTGLRIVKGAGGALAIAGNGEGGGQAATDVASGQGLRGAIVDANSGAALKGAFVELVGTGQTTATDELGRYRFPGVNGAQRVRISYLGFPAVERDVEFANGLPVTGIVLANEAVANEILVVGYTSARAQALNQERTAENSSTVISGDLLGNFNGTTISDALRRAPGVAFQQDNKTGDGTNIIVRGLSPDYNQVKLNGLALPESEGLGRSPNLSNILADSISEIKISKTLLPSQDSTGTGGLVEIETKSPLDRPKRYFNVSVDGTKRSKGFGHEYGASGTASLRFGADGNFGVSASLQYRNQDIRSYSYSINGIFGPYLPLLPNGQPARASTLDPRTPFPFYDGADYFVSAAQVGANETQSETYSASLSAEWQVSDATNLRFDYVGSRRTDTNYQSTYFISTDTAIYRLAPVPSLGGAQRFVYFPRPLDVAPVVSVLYAPDQKSRTDSFSFRGESDVGRLTLKYAAGYAKGSSASPLSSSFSMLDDPGIRLTAADILPEAIDPLTGNYVTYFGPRRGKGIPIPLFTADVFQRLANAPLPILSAYSAAIDQRGRSQNWTGDLSAKYEFAPGILKYVEAGLGYRRSSFANAPSRSDVYSPVYLDDGYPVPLDQVGIEFENLPFSTGGNETIYRLPTRASVEQFIGNLDRYASDGYLEHIVQPADPLYADQGTVEEQIIAYIQARADIGKLEIIGGVRAERNHVATTSVTGTSIYDENGDLDTPFYLASRTLVSGRKNMMTYLPRLLINYRPSENIVLRGGYYSTIARPQVLQLNAERVITYYAQPTNGPTGTQTFLSITSGNPGLKPARTHNFDISGEWYDGNVGVIKLSAFYKRINNLLESNSIRGFDSIGDLDLPDHPLLNNLPDDVLVSFTYPVNNPDPATIWGIEAAVERRLTFLPGVLSGLGIYANYVYSDSHKTQPRSWFGPQFDANGTLIGFADQPYELEVPFNQSPRHSGTIGLTYSKGGVDASLFYTAQARRQGGVANFGMNVYNEAVSSLDFRAVYQFKLAGSDVRFSFEGLNLLKGRNDPNTSGSIGGVGDMPKYYTDGYFLGGRKFTLGLSATF